MTIKIAVNKLTNLCEIWDEVIEENGWVIEETSDHRWALHGNAEWMDKPFKVYENHQLADAINQGQKFT